MSVCHTVVPEKNGVDDAIEYQASSPGLCKQTHINNHVMTCNMNVCNFMNYTKKVHVGNNGQDL